MIKISKTTKKVTIIGGMTLTGMIILMYSLAIYGISIEANPNDFACEGSKTNQCIYPFNITVSNYSLVFDKNFRIYLNDSKASYSIQKKDTIGRWRDYNFTGKSLAIGKYEFRAIVYKKSPYDNVKIGIDTSGIAKVDPVLQSVADINLIEESNTMTDGLAVIEINPQIAYTLKGGEISFFVNKLTSAKDLNRLNLSAGYNVSYEDAEWTSNFSCENVSKWMVATINSTVGWANATNCTDYGYFKNITKSRIDYQPFGNLYKINVTKSRWNPKIECDLGLLESGGNFTQNCSDNGVTVYWNEAEQIWNFSKASYSLNTGKYVGKPIYLKLEGSWPLQTQFIYDWKGNLSNYITSFQWWLTNYSTVANYTINTTSTVPITNLTVPLLVGNASTDGNIFWIRQLVNPASIVNGSGLLYNNSQTDYRAVNGSDNQEYAMEVERGAALNRTNGQGSAWDDALVARWGASSTMDSIGTRHLVMNASSALNSSGLIGGGISSLYNGSSANFTDIDVSKTAITIMGWFRKYETANNQKLLGSMCGANTEIALGYYGSIANKWFCDVYTNTDHLIYSYTPAVANVWTHVACSYDGKTQSLYVNGTLVASAALTGAVKDANTNWLWAGEGSGCDKYYYLGDTDEARVYTGRNLSAAEIKAIKETTDPSLNYVNTTTIFQPTAAPNPFSLTACSNITTSGKYTLDAPITDSTNVVCMNIAASDVEFDCGNYGNWIDGTNLGGSYAIKETNASYISNITVKNCNITDWAYGFSTGTSENISFLNNRVHASASGVYFGDLLVNHTTIRNNTFIDTENAVYANKFNDGLIEDNMINDSGANYHAGIYFDINSNDSVVRNNIIDHYTWCFLVENSFNNVFINNTCNRGGIPAFVYYDGPISFISGSNFNVVKNVNFSNSASNIYSTASHNSFIDSSMDVSMTLIGVTNWTVLNTTYGSGATESISSSNLTRQWYVEVNVTNSSGQAINGQNVKAYNRTDVSSGGITASGVTGTGGKFTFNLTSYFNDSITGAATNFSTHWYSNYTINATNVTWGTGSIQVNVTGNAKYNITLGPDMNINGCSNLSSPGVYTLTVPITNWGGEGACMNVTTDNVGLDCKGFNNWIDGTDTAGTIGIQTGGSWSSYLEANNVTIRNCNVTDFYRGINVFTDTTFGIVDNISVSSCAGDCVIGEGSANVNFSNVTIFSCDGPGMYLAAGPYNLWNINSSNNQNEGFSFSYGGNNIVMRDSYAQSNGGNGIQSWEDWQYGYADNVQIINATIRNNGKDGINLLNGSATDWNITNSTISDNKNYGLWLEYETGLIITGCNISNNSAPGYAGIMLRSNESSTRVIGYNTSKNKIYNNIFNNSVNAKTFGINYSNWFNTTKVAGTNIIGKTYFGGNYWSDYTGISTNGDYLGDTAYVINGSLMNDSLPLVFAETSADTCTCPAINNSWNMKWRDNCTINSVCNIGNGTFHLYGLGAGSLVLNAQLICSGYQIEFTTPRSILINKTNLVIE